jgi:hypothetical protein
VLSKTQEKVCKSRAILRFLMLNLGSKMKGLDTNVDPRKQKKIWVQKQTLPGHGYFALVKRKLSSFY